MRRSSSSNKLANSAAWRTLPRLSSPEQQQFMKTTFHWTLYSSLTLANEFRGRQDVIDATSEWLANGNGIAEEALAAARRNTSRGELSWATLTQLRQAVPQDAI